MHLIIYTIYHEIFVLQNFCVFKTFVGRRFCFLGSPTKKPAVVIKIFVRYKYFGGFQQQKNVLVVSSNNGN